MPLYIPPVIGGLGQTNLTAAARSGTTVTASASANTKGSYSSLIDPTSKPSYGIWIRFLEVGNPATVTNILVDIAYGPTGGGNEQIVIPNLSAGGAPTGTDSGVKSYWFPVYIPTGVRVSARCQASTGSDTVSVAVYLDQDPSYPWSLGSATAYGADTANSRGTSVTPGSGAFGSWTQIGAGTDPVQTHRAWTIGYDQLADTTIGTVDLIIEIGTGPDSANVTTIGSFTIVQASNENISGPFPLICYAIVNAGGELWARIASGETEARGVIVYGIS